MTRARPPRAAWAAALVPLLAGCGPTLVGGAAGFDAGTLGVGGVETGIGGQAELIFFDRGGRWGGGPAFQWAGYRTEGDADPIAFTTAELRRHVGRLEGAYMEFGGGIGGAWSSGLRRIALPLQAEVGVAARVGGFRGRVALRERFVGLIGDGTPPADAFNSVQIAFALWLGRVQEP